MALKIEIKNIVYKFWVFRQMLIIGHKMTGQRPWGFGYSVHKFDFIRHTIQNKKDYFITQRLPLGYGFGFDERVVEYPWVLTKLKSSEKTILDAGCTLNHYDILTLKELRQRNLYMMTLTQEQKFPWSNLKYFQGDLRDLPFESDFFDGVVSISTLEHIGMDNMFLYTDDPTKKEAKPKEHLKAVRELRRVLKTGGTMYLTVPFGRYQDHGWFQVFDGHMIEQMVAEFRPTALEETYFRYSDKHWHYAHRHECQDSCYFDIHKERNLRGDYLAASESVACLAMIK